MNWGVRVLQTRALPLGYGALLSVSCAHYLKAFRLNGADDEARPTAPLSARTRTFKQSTGLFESAYADRPVRAIEKQP